MKILNILRGFAQSTPNMHENVLVPKGALAATNQNVLPRLNRRNFLFGLGATVAGIALEQAIPLGRVWSFPKDIKLNTGTAFVPFPEIYYDRLAVLEWQANTPVIELLKDYRPMPRRSARSMQLYHGVPA